MRSRQIVVDCRSQLLSLKVATSPALFCVGSWHAHEDIYRAICKLQEGQLYNTVFMSDVCVNDNRSLPTSILPFCATTSTAVVRFPLHYFVMKYRNCSFRNIFPVTLHFATMLFHLYIKLPAIFVSQPLDIIIPSNQNMTEPRIAVLGAGPKAAALHVLSCALRRLNRPYVHVVSWEMSKPAAHWDGEHGFTSGFDKLGTSPLKDVTFPGSFGEDPVLDKELSKFSWLTYLRCNGLLDKWVDRDCPPCSHKEWAAYLRWVFVQSNADVRQSQVYSVEPTGDGKVRLHFSNHKAEIFDGFVYTGPGAVRNVPLKSEVDSGDDKRVLNARNYWMNRAAVHGARRVAVIGTGESAAAILNDLVSVSRMDISVVTTHGYLPTRDESYSMNSFFSHADGKRWRNLPLQTRRGIIRRGDRGVLSPGCHQEMMRLQRDIQEIDGRSAPS